MGVNWGLVALADITSCGGQFDVSLGAVISDDTRQSRPNNSVLSLVSE